MSQRTAPIPQPSKLMRLVLSVMVVGFAIAAVATAVVIQTRQNALLRSNRYDITWSTIQAGIENSRFGTSVAQALVEPTRRRLDEAADRYAILRSRAHGFNTGDFRAYADAEADRRASVDEFVRRVESMAPLVKTLDSGDNAKRLLAMTTSYQRDLALLAADANGYYGRETEEARRLIERCNRIYSFLLFGLVISSVALILMLSKALARIQSMARRDFLTGLVNRMSLNEKMTTSLEGTAGGGPHTALIALDLDRFKAVNDTLGHHVGDLMIKTVAARIEAAAGRMATVARLGGDEFCVLLHDYMSQEDVVGLASRILDRIAEPMDLDGHKVAIHSSAGVAFVASGEHAPADLMKRADLALYRSKEKGTGVQAFESTMDEPLQLRRKLEGDLGTAVDRLELRLHFQPIVPLSGPTSVVAREALVRWEHPTFGMIPPGDFIPVAEETGLIVPLGAWIMQEACRQAAAWEGSERVTVNVSPVQFRRDDVPALVARSLAATGLSPDRLVIEITETALMDDVDKALATVDQIRAQGVRIAIDDFGTGYSSLRYISNFRPDKLKIDRSFVAGIEKPENRLIVEMVAAMGRKLGITVVAEGVETQIQAAVLASMGCHEGQGYLFGRPEPIEAAPSKGLSERAVA